jgi:hypothetical protein
MVSVISQHNLPEPSTDLGHAMMHPALKLNLDGFEFRNHSLLRSDPPYGEGSALVALPTVVGKAQEGKGLWLSLSPLLPIASDRRVIRVTPLPSIDPISVRGKSERNFSVKG